MVGVRATVLAAGILALAMQGGLAANPCGEVTGIMRLIVNMGESCFETCPDVCTPLGGAVTKFLSKEDPWTEICAEEAAWTCPFNTESCQELLDKAAGLDFPVPETLDELDDKCKDYSSKKSKSKSKSKKAPSADATLQALHAGEDHEEPPVINATTTEADAAGFTAPGGLVALAALAALAA